MTEQAKLLAIKVDVDTDRGTRIGVPNLLKLFSTLGLTATFLFSLGPDNTGRAIKRIFRPGFLKKVSRTSVLKVYGLRTLLNGTVLPAPHIGKRNEKILQQCAYDGHEIGIHCYDHIRWQDGLATMSEDEVKIEFDKAQTEFERIFGFRAQTAGAAGWQANAYSLKAYDNANLIYGSDARGTCPFFPKINNHIYKVLQIPTTLPTLDERLGHPDYPLDRMTEYYLTQFQSVSPNVLTIHAELEGMAYLSWFENFLKKVLLEQTNIVPMKTIAKMALEKSSLVPVCEMKTGSISGRSGTLAIQN